MEQSRHRTMRTATVMSFSLSKFDKLSLVMLFSELACFSPSVPASFRKAWVKNGGTLTHTAKDFFRANFYFCYGLCDPWLPQLLRKSLLVRHPDWISSCIEEQSFMPTAPYTFNSHLSFTLYEAAKLEIRTPKPRMNSTATQTDDDDDTLRVDDDSFSSQVQLKRDISTGDLGIETYARIAKKSRIHENNPSVTAYPLFQAAHVRKLAEPRRVNFLLPSLSPTQKNSTSSSYERLDLRRITSESLTNKRCKFEIKLIEPIDLSKHFEPERKPSKSASQIAASIDAFNSDFWKRTTDACSDSGPLVMSMNDILNSEGRNLTSRIFVPGETFRGEKFSCFWKDPA